MKKYAHISFDDVYTSLYDITQNEDSYNSVFDNAFFAALKTLHDKYNAVFSLYLFNKFTDSDYSLSTVTGKFFDEFAANSDWLKFGFHAECDQTNYNTAGNIEASYDVFRNAVLKKLGGENALDRFTRLGFFAATQENVLKLKNESLGIIGLLAADDDRISYSLEPEFNSTIINRGAAFNLAQDLLYVRSQPRLDSVKSGNEITNDFFNPHSFTNTKILEIFLHEYSFYNQDFTPQVLEDCVKWVSNENYSFGFIQDNYDLIKNDVLSECEINNY